MARIWAIRGHWLEINLERETGASSCFKLGLYPEGTMNPYTKGLANILKYNLLRKRSLRRHGDWIGGNMGRERTHLEGIIGLRGHAGGWSIRRDA